MANRFNEKYSGFHFGEGEEIRMLIRRHWIVNAKMAISSFFWVLLVPLFTITAYWVYKKGILFDKNFAVMLVGLGVYMSVVSLYTLAKWLNHSYDVIIVTNDRVIDITQVDFFHRNILETRLVNVQDATGDVNGFFNTLFDWGRIEIRTANDVADFSIEMIACPHQRAREIFDIARQAQENELKKGFYMEHQYKKKEKKKTEANDRLKLFSPASYRQKINALLQGND